MQLLELHAGLLEEGLLAARHGDGELAGEAHVGGDYGWGTEPPTEDQSDDDEKPCLHTALLRHESVQNRPILSQAFPEGYHRKMSLTGRRWKTLISADRKSTRLNSSHGYI